MTIHKPLIGCLLALLATSPVYAAAIATKLPNQGHPGYRLVIDDSLAVSATGYHVGIAFTSARINFELGSDFDGNLYACDNTTFDADECDEILDIPAADASTTAFTARRNYVLVVSTDEGATSTSILDIKGTNAQVASAFDPTLEVVFEDAVDADDPLVYAVYDIRPIALYCVASGATDPTTHAIMVAECNTTGASCVTVGLDVTLNGVDDFEQDVDPTDTLIAQGNWYGIHTDGAPGTAATLANCTFHAERS